MPRPASTPGPAHRVEHTDPVPDDALVPALAALTRGDRRAATDAARRAHDADGDPLARALADHLQDPAGASVYDQPAAFAAFIDGGGNIPLYQAVSRALATAHDRHRVRTLLDVGCGDGRALVPALHTSGHRPAVVDLLDPSPALLGAAVRRMADEAPAITARPWATTAQAFTATDLHEQTWDLVQATFALQSLPADERTSVLTALRPHTRHLLVVEFDVPDLPHDSTENLRSLATRYRQGLREYTTDRDLVARGFLMPVLTGQLLPAAPGTARTNYEQPAPAWAAQVADAGYQHVRVDRLHDYWSSPAFVLTARGGA